MVAKNQLINTNPILKTYHFKRVKYFPNNILPLLIYKAVFELGGQKRLAAKKIQTLLYKNNWKNAWSNGIYGFHHYHSSTHECLAIASGKAAVIFGGPGGKKITVQKGDLLIIPAGLSHKCSKASEDFLCVGAYPGGKQYDIMLGTRDEFEKSMTRIAKLGLPSRDPAFGREGFLKSLWK